MRAGPFLAAAETLPFAKLTTLTGGRGIVVVAPHPDDESLGCGGLIATACAAAIPVRLVIVSDGVGSHPNSAAYPPDRLCELREAETRDAVAALGLRPEHVRFLRLPDRYVPSAGPDADEAAAVIAETASAIDAGAVAVTWRHDPHCDHGAAAALVDLARPSLPDIRVLAYPVWGWALPTDAEVGAAPRGARLDISAHLAAKGRAVAAHRSQVGDIIDDDPTGFRLDPAMLRRFARPFEIYLDDAP